MSNNEDRIKKELGFLDRYLTLWIALAMILGILLGRYLPRIPNALNAFKIQNISLPIAVGLFVMMYPILTKVRYDEIPEVTSIRKKEIFTTLGFNWLVAPFLMYFLATQFLSNYPEYMTGLIIVGIAPCIAMVLVWNRLACGNQEVCAICVGTNSLLQILLFVPYAFLFLTLLQGTEIEVSMTLIAKSVFIFLGLPLIFGFLTQEISQRTRGKNWYRNKFMPKLEPLTLLGLLFTVVVMFSLKGDVILSQPMDIALISIPLFIYFAGTFSLAYISSALFRFNYTEAVSVSFTAASNNFELAIAVAVAVFGIGSGVALATVIGPLIEVPVMLGLVKVALNTRKYLFPE